jgi:hypothetical protein
MGGEIRWESLPWIAQWMGCEDMDTLVPMLIAIRDYDEMRKSLAAHNAQMRIG